MLNSFTTVTTLIGTSCAGVALLCGAAVSLERPETAPTALSHLALSRGVERLSSAQPAPFLVSQQPTQANPPYPPEAQQGFMTACVNAAVDSGATQRQAEDYCLCSLAEFQQVYTFQEFLLIDQQLGQGQSPPDAFVAVVQFCASQVVGG
jgi:hypothetical protein